MMWKLNDCSRGGSSAPLKTALKRDINLHTFLSSIMEGIQYIATYCCIFQQLEANLVFTSLGHGHGKKTNVSLRSWKKRYHELISTISTTCYSRDPLLSEQFDFVRRFNPDCKLTHDFGHGKGTAELGAIGVCCFTAQFLLVGHGYQDEDYYSLKDVTLDGFGHVDFHADPLSLEQFTNGQAKFFHFYFDDIIYGAHPSYVNAFRCVK
ncbi:uncharacterized protein BDR25DRAFT_351958 [Lindgomyces ingoldianus]|uniref:Uncharacterized protein n=1 Tax=Lindgomyces ingoldianus TaxID=673940 RepID=A0ACB6R560_9PLEO|nr:uncharacterized protein BDR25DRAFT_351958 [Lindgomyces ingoldianus]KAF2474418.1 hypothetical protein BDR25DRAFT_351958 [Lindgomyces ingoldianus]